MNGFDQASVGCHLIPGPGKRPLFVRIVGVLAVVAGAVLVFYAAWRVFFAPPPPPLPIEREFDVSPYESNVGRVIQRISAANGLVLGQFGAEELPGPRWPKKAGYVKYSGIELRKTNHIYLRIWYSKASPSSTPIKIYLDDEFKTSFIPVNHCPPKKPDWNQFYPTDPIDLGSVKEGTHSIKFATEGQEYGVADLDRFTLTYLP